MHLSMRAVISAYVIYCKPKHRAYLARRDERTDGVIDGYEHSIRFYD